MGKYLDLTGLQALWNKMKSWVSANFSSKEHTHSALNSAFYFNNSNISVDSTNLIEGQNPNSLNFYRNGVLIPNPGVKTDGGMLRVNGTDESNTVVELSAFDDRGEGETIQFNYYGLESHAPVYSVAVPKRSGTVALTSDLTDCITSVNVSGSGDVVTGISKSGNSLNIMKGKIGGSTSAEYVYRSMVSNGGEEPILQVEHGEDREYYVEILRNAKGHDYCGGEIRLKAFNNSTDSTHSLQICPLGIRSDGKQIFRFDSTGIYLYIDNITLMSADGEALNFDVGVAKDLGLV